MSDLLKINVNDHTEKKNGLTYLSWAWAWAEVLKIDPQAQWCPLYFGPETNQVPYLMLPDTSMMVGVSVSIKGETKQCLLPVMNHRNQAIKNPDAFAINTAIMRCLAKAIAMHGLGLYIYAGEDLPEDAELETQLKASIVQAGGVIKATDGAESFVSADRASELDELALHMIDCHKSGKDGEAIRIWYASDTFQDNEERVYTWKQLGAESKLRSLIKANQPKKEAA